MLIFKLVPSLIPGTKIITFGQFLIPRIKLGTSLRINIMYTFDQIYNILQYHFYRLKNINYITYFDLIICQQSRIFLYNPQQFIQQEPKMQNSQVYIQLYNSLTNTQSSQKANQQLIRIQLSEQSWNIAKELVHNQQYHMHGCQLLSKKLNRPYTHEMESKHKIGDFIMGLPQLNKVLYFCLAKLALQLGWQNIQLKAPHNNTETLLNVLKSVPEAASVITLSDRHDQRERASKLYQVYKEFLVNSFSTHTEDVLQCIQNFTTNNFKLESEQLFKLILAQPLSKVNEILENVLLTQNYQTYNNEIYQYLIKNSSNTWEYFMVFLSFTRSLQLLTLPTDVLSGLLSKILEIMSTENTLSPNQRKNISYINDSFDFWVQLQQKLLQQLKSKSRQAEIKICLDAFVEVWKIVIQRSMQYEMPKFKLKQDDNLAISLDDDTDNLQEQIQTCINSNKFRTSAEDFLLVCYRILKKNKQYETKALSFLFELTKSNNPLHFELAIFVMSCIVEQAGAAIQEISALIQSITQNHNAKQPYIWQQLIKLMGKLGHQTICDPRIFQTVLIMLKQSIQIPQLAVLAIENFNQILKTCNNSSQKASQTPLIQQFFDYIYANIYFKTADEKLFNKLTKSTIIFIYYFRPDLQYFKSYLTALSEKVQTLASLQDRCNVIENLAICHNFVLSENSMVFTSTISEFFVAFMPTLISQIQKCPTKKMNNLFSQFGTLINVGGGYNTEIWLQGLLMLFNIPKVRQQKASFVNLTNKLMTVEQFDQKYKSSISKLICNVEPFVTEYLTESSQNDVKLINRCLTFHFNILNLHIDIAPNYNPDRVLSFIVGKIYKSYLRFQFDSSKISLAIVRNIMSRNYHVEALLEETLKVYPKLVDLLWKSLEAILYQAYKIGGTQVYRKVFANIQPAILPPNPLFDALIEALKNSNSKDFKNLLASLN